VCIKSTRTLSQELAKMMKKMAKRKKKAEKNKNWAELLGIDLESFFGFGAWRQCEFLYLN